jgi:hypothetical protein
VVPEPSASFEEISGTLAARLVVQLADRLSVVESQPSGIPSMADRSA